MGDIAERIANVKKEAEALKEKIKQKKDILADTTCMSILSNISRFDIFM